MKCWDAKAENRPSAKELYQILNKWDEEEEKYNKPISSSDLTSFRINSDDVPSISTNLISECLDVQLSESDLNEIIQEEDNLNDET
ncbi:unnamed protein product [Rhizophagus irregularis]|nr:unnamed protein product [Rhizophagus irregularis]